MCERVSGPAPRRRWSTAVLLIVLSTVLCGLVSPARSQVGGGPRLGPATPGLSADEAKRAIQGSVALEHFLISAVRPQDVLYIMAFAVDATPGSPPLAVRRIDRPTFPLAYALTDRDRLSREPFEGTVRIMARVDKDGVAGGRVGDLEGWSRGQPVTFGARGVDILIDHVR